MLFLLLFQPYHRHHGPAVVIQVGQELPDSTRPPFGLQRKFLADLLKAVGGGDVLAAGFGDDLRCGLFGEKDQSVQPHLIVPLNIIQNPVNTGLRRPFANDALCHMSVTHIPTAALLNHLTGGKNRTRLPFQNQRLFAAAAGFLLLDPAGNGDLDPLLRSTVHCQRPHQFHIGNVLGLGQEPRTAPAEQVCCEHTAEYPRNFSHFCLRFPSGFRDSSRSLMSGIGPRTTQPPPLCCHSLATKGVR